MASPEQGYDDERFPNAVSKNLHCAICLNVFKDPVMCKENEHFFCRSCITRHLENTQACPTCMDYLTAEALREAPRVLKEWLSELIIHCDYSDRGCREIIQLGNFQTHVNKCDFAPVICSNEGCHENINKRDQRYHESEICDFRKLKCHDCAEVKESLASIHEKLDGLMSIIGMNFAKVNEDLKEVKMNSAVAANDMHEMRKNQAEAFTEIREVRTCLTEVDHEWKANQTAVNDKVKVNLAIIEDQLRTLTQSCNIRQCVEMQREKMSQAISNEKCHPVGRQHNITIAGGSAASGKPSSSVENFCWSKKSWELLQPMKISRDEASSFVCEDQMIVTGGYSDNIEALPIKPVKHSQPWFFLPAKLPSELSGHSTVLYNERLISVGGHDRENCCDSIYEVLLKPPYSRKLLTQMPKARCCHGSLLLHDQILICGGRSSDYYCDTMDSVLVYDILENECREMPPLLYAVSGMGIVKLGDNAVIIGGVGKDGKVLNSVFTYNIKTGKSHFLPEMNCAKEGCVAVAVGSSVVVMGGQDTEGHSLKMVETFSFESYDWQVLPSMNNERSGATAVAW